MSMMMDRWTRWNRSDVSNAVSNLAHRTSSTLILAV